MFRPRRSTAPSPFPVLVILSLVAIGCSDSGAPDSGDPNGIGRFDGSIDPQQGEFVLQAIDVPAPDGRHVDLRLIGRNLQADPQRNLVSLEVAVENADVVPVHAPGQVDIGEFQPTTVAPVNADQIVCPTDSTPGIPVELDDDCFYVYDYSNLLGSDERLDPGERSVFRIWEFLDPNLEGFSFSAAVRFRMEPEGALIAGEFFLDDNRNRVRDPGEEAWGAGAVTVRGPGIPVTTAFAGENGAWQVAIREPGLHTLVAFSPLDFGPFEPQFTTPNPLEVVITPGPTGEPQSFRHAHFGVLRFPPFGPPPVLFWEPGDSLGGDYYGLVEIGLDEANDYLDLTVRFSGCQPEHPFQLYVVGGIDDAFPPQPRLVLVHDGLGEFCEALWHKDLLFDLAPLAQQLGSDAGVITLRFEDFNGETTYLEWTVGRAEPQ